MLSTYQSVFRAGLFSGQVAIVTGGGSGIGRCTAHELASLGARVALVGRKIEKLSAVKDEIAKATESLKSLDKNGDGKLTQEEFRPAPGSGPPGGAGAPPR